MKRIRFVFLTLVCACLLCACNKNKQAIGQVTAYENGILSVQTQQGKTYDFQVDPDDTLIIGMLGDEEDPLGDGTDRQVQVTYSKKQGKYYAQTIFVSARLRRNAMSLSDGTPIDIWERSGGREYCLQDGTTLLVEDHYVGPENSSGWNELDFNEDFPEEAKQGILDYYAQMGLRYDIPALLEDAYLVYSLSEEFNAQLVSQHISIEAWNENIISCKMYLHLPQERSNGGADSFWEGAVFDRQTGEHIPNYDLFAITREELEECLLFQLKLGGTQDQEKIALNLKPEQMVLCKDGDIAFYLVDCEQNGVRSMLEIELSSGQAEMILQPWAVIG